MLTCTCSSLTVCGAPPELEGNMDAPDARMDRGCDRPPSVRLVGGAQMEAVMDAVTTDSSYDALIGSSFGGLAVANAASRLRDHPLHLVLLAPAFGHPDLIRADLGPEVMAMWERTGYHRFEPVGWEAPIDLPWSFMAEGADLDWPDLVHPTGILHGRQDAVVPYQNSERAVAGSEVADVDLGGGRPSLGIVLGSSPDRSRTRQIQCFKYTRCMNYTMDKWLDDYITMRLDAQEERNGIRIQILPSFLARWRRRA